MWQGNARGFSKMWWGTNEKKRLTQTTPRTQRGLGGKNNHKASCVGGEGMKKERATQRDW
jgi:hypothetical protein